MLRKYFLFFVILLFGIIIRLINLDKSAGLWYDEMTIYSIASQKSIIDIFNTDSHRFLLFPLYYLIYHLWLFIFGNSDLVIRLMSVFFDILGIISAFFVGKEIAKRCNINEYNCGTIYMLLFALNSLLIYYAQEAKFYSLTTFIVNLVLLSWLKYINERSNKFFILLFLTSLLLILTYTSQCILVLIIFLATLLYFFLSKNHIPKKHLLIFPTVFIPVIILISCIPNYFSGNFDAVVIDSSFLFLILQNFFTPILNSLQNNITNYHIVLIKNFSNISFWLFVIYPIVYLLFSAIYSVKKHIITRYLIGISLSYICLHIIISQFTNYTPLIRYLIPILPFVLAACSVGICQQKRKMFLIIFIIINVFVLISPLSATEINRPDGYKELAEMLKSNNITASADFIMPIRTNLLDKYYYIEGKRISLYTLNNPEFQKTYLTDEEINKIEKADLTSAYYRYFISNKIPSQMGNAIFNNFIKNNKIVLIKDNTICLYDNNQIKEIALSEYYKQVPIQFLRLSKLNNDLISILSQKMRLEKTIKSTSWDIYVFTN